MWWLSAAVYLALAFAVPLIAILAAMSLSRIGQPTAAQLRAKRAALLAVAAPTLFTFVGVVLYMLRDPVPDTWLWVPCWAIVLPLLLWSDNDAPARVVAPNTIRMMLLFFIPSRITASPPTSKIAASANAIQGRNCI